MTMKQIMFLVVILSLVALSFAGYHHHPEFKAIKEKACDTTTKITEKQWTDLMACSKGCNDTQKRMADFQSAVSGNCSSSANEAELQTLKLANNVEQNNLVNEFCSANYQKCKTDLMKMRMKDHKKGEHKNAYGDEGQKKKHEAFKQKMEEHMKCMKTAVGITA